jgi:hypothetical protein
MSTVTLDDIKATQARLAEMIANLEAQQQARSFYLQAATIDLQPGERYAGIVLGHDAEASYHLILLPGDAEGLTHDAALKWAADAGGELPSRREQALLYANLKSEFKEAWYWSAQLHESYPDYAWYQYFLVGSQTFSYRNYELRARAVRRLIIH